MDINVTPHTLLQLKAAQPLPRFKATLPEPEKVGLKPNAHPLVNAPGALERWVAGGRGP